MTRQLRIVRYSKRNYKFRLAGPQRQKPKRIADWGFSVDDTTKAPKAPKV
jgi:hypothetical protein